jgi:ferredoxin
VATIKLVADYAVEPCIGCKLCDIVCPSGAIRMEARKPIIDDALCIGCGRCVDRCPEDIMWMKERGEPLTITVRPEEADQAAVAALLEKAGLEPAMSVCVCTLTPGSEIAAAIVKGAQNLEEVCAMTGMRSGCGIYCVAPALRLLEAAGRDMTPPGQHRWYPSTLSLYDLSDEVCAKYPDAYIAEDRETFDPEHKYGPLPKEVV